MYTSEFLTHFPGSAYQTFPDSKNSKTFPQKGSFLDITKEELQALNKKGAGIFFTPNGMERGHRDSKHCTHVNAYFVDMDEGTKAEQYSRIAQSPITPSFIIESRNGYHVYFLAPRASKDTFRQVQTALIEYFQGDKQCKDISRVLRLPNFFHLKDIKNPFKVNIVESNPSITYTEHEIVELFNIDTSPASDTPSEYTKKDHAAPTTFWEAAAQIDCASALLKLSGTDYVNNEIIELRERPQGGQYIIINGQMANAWIDEQGMIGSGAKGGPTIIQWLSYYGHSYSQIANIVRALFISDIPKEILEGELVQVESPKGEVLDLIQKPVEDIKAVQELGDAFILSHKGNLYFCMDDQTVYKYDTEKKYHIGYSPMTIDKYINNYTINTLGYTKSMTKNMRTEMYYQIKYRAPEIFFADSAYVSLKDGLLNLDTLELEPHTPDIFCTMHVPLTLEELKSATCPVHDKFVDDIMVFENDPTQTDPDLKEKYLQIMGYFLSPKQRPHAFIFFIGEKGRNGKGTGANLLKDILGHQFCSSLTLEKLSNSAHGPAALVGKRLNVCGEDESAFIRNDILKTLASEDSISINPKFKDEFDYKPIAKYLLMSNSNPKFSTIDNAMKRRIHIIPHNREFKEEEMNWDLQDQLKAEIPGIIWKFAQAYQRLAKNNYIFHKSEQSTNALLALESDVSSVVEWTRENLAIDASEFFATTDLYRIYKVWCEDAGRKAVHRNRWGKEVSAELGINSERRTIAGSQVRGYTVKLVDN